MLGHLYWFHSWGCYLGCISEAYLINWFVVHWFPSDDREFVVPSLGNFSLDMNWDILSWDLLVIIINLGN